MFDVCERANIFPRRPRTRQECLIVVETLSSEIKQGKKNPPIWKEKINWDTSPTLLIYNHLCRKSDGLYKS